MESLPPTSVYERSKTSFSSDSSFELLSSEEHGSTCSDDVHNFAQGKQQPGSVSISVGLECVNIGFIQSKSILFHTLANQERSLRSFCGSLSMLCECLGCLVEEKVDWSLPADLDMVSRSSCSSSETPIGI